MKLKQFSWYLSSDRMKITQNDYIFVISHLFYYLSLFCFFFFVERSSLAKELMLLSELVLLALCAVLIHLLSNPFVSLVGVRERLSWLLIQIGATPIELHQFPCYLHLHLSIFLSIFLSEL
jgi:hypothetical protein